MHNADPGSVPVPRTLDCTLFFSDIRRFTDFAERHSPQEVIDRLNHLIRVQVDLLERFGADVDKFVGDAVFARFEGPGREAAAIDAAMAIQRHLKTADLGLPVGIGIASGTVVAGVIGAADRYDYTVLGDAVNVASRLCSLAAGGEVMVDRKTAEGAAYAARDWESLAVKGRTGTVEALRLAGGEA
ncbi:MAG: adenylate/guanylate cyclase domain-containing protein, partial [Alphaproteobacteria bacterium]